MSKEKIVYKSAKDIPLNAMSVDLMLFNKTGAWRNVRPVIHRHGRRLGAFSSIPFPFWAFGLIRISILPRNCA